MQRVLVMDQRSGNARCRQLPPRGFRLAPQPHAAVDGDAPLLRPGSSSRQRGAAVLVGVGARRVRGGDRRAAAPPHSDGARRSSDGPVSRRAFSLFNRCILAGIYLCHACSFPSSIGASWLGSTYVTPVRFPLQSVHLGWDLPMSRLFVSLFNRCILAGIYLCHACSYREIEDGDARAGGMAPR
jgi:hypothetical protein